MSFDDKPSPALGEGLLLMLPCILYLLFVAPIDKVQLLAGTCEGCIEPAVVVGVYHLLADVALVYEYPLPLAALCLVAGDGIAIFHLQGIVVRVLAYLFHALAL